MRKLVCEQRPGVQQLAAVDFLPLIGGTVRVVTFRREWVSWRAEGKKIEQEPLVIPLVAVRQEAGLGLPAVGERRPTIARPVPVGPAVERVDQGSDFGLFLGVSVEVGGAGKGTREQER